MRVTHEVGRYVKALPDWVKVAGSVVAVLTSLYGGLRYIVRSEVKDLSATIEAAFKQQEKDAAERRAKWQAEARARTQREVDALRHADDEIKRRLERLEAQ